MSVFPQASIAYVPALIGAFLSVICVRIGFLEFLFLLPLGVVAYSCRGKTPWFCLFLAVLGNGILSLGLALAARSGAEYLGGEALFFSVMAAAFIWIAAPPAEGPRIFRVDGAYRFAAASLLGVLSLLPVMVSGGKGGGFHTYLQAQAEMLASLYTTAYSGGVDAVQRSLTEQYITPEFIAGILGSAALRGGAAASCFMVFAVSRQLARLITSLFRRERPAGGSLVLFHVPPPLIWVLSCSLLGILLGLKIRVSLLEIMAWNVLVICVMLYLAQGGGILLAFLSRMPLPPLMRVLVNLLFFIVLVSPGINAIFLGSLVILGIAENWAPFRALKSNGSSSTPGM